MLASAIRGEWNPPRIALASMLVFVTCAIGPRTMHLLRRIDTTAARELDAPRVSPR